jgi:ABC-type amino acid transport substrate-binding protein
MKTRSTVLWRVIVCCTSIFITLLIISAGTVYADLDGVKQRGVLRHLGMPYAAFITGSGDGMDVELMQRFAKHLGVRYEFVNTDWNNIFGELTGNNVRAKGNDIEITTSMPIKGDVAANGITVLAWREKAVNFSLPTFPNQVWLVARSNSPLKPIKPSGNLEKDITAVKKIMKGKSLLGKVGTCLDPSLYNLQEITDKIKLFPGSLNDMAPALIQEETELTLLDVPDALVALQKWPGKIKIIGPVSEVQDMAAAFSKDSPELLAEFNRFLAKAKKDGSFAQLAKKYYPFVSNYYPKFFAR